MNKHAQSVQCEICRKSFPHRDCVPAEFVRPPLADLIKKEHPEWTGRGYICHADLNRYRAAYVQSALEHERGDLSELEREVLKSVHEHETLARDINSQFDRESTLSERVADRVAEFGGSWKFIFFFGAVIAIWIAVNSILFFGGPFDPYPFILLNLVLSCLAALQAPVIMMSQNRQEAKDRLRSEHDYRVNLKAELEIRQLNAKIDLLMTHQWQRLMEIQQLQTDLMQELASRSEK
jgi:uncharacterized membrane protein